MIVEYMTTAEVAELCRTSAESVRWWRHVGRGPESFRVGRRVLYESAEVRRWLDDLKRSERASVMTPGQSPLHRGRETPTAYEEQASSERSAGRRTGK